MPQVESQGFALTDFHIHLRGGMTAEKAVDRWKQSKIRSGVLENLGRDWPLSSNEKLRDFIADAQKTASTLNCEERKQFYIGIQVNDRDWYKTIDPVLMDKLDFVLADTMIMGTNEEGNPQKLWLLPTDYPVDVDQWFADYLKHNLQILDEPVSILANPTYLPAFAAEHYNRLWTQEAMEAVIDKAIANNVALEIQAESPYPKAEFITLAKAKGAKFSFGSNNMDDKLKSLDRWYEGLTRYDLEPSDLWRPECSK